MKWLYFFIFSISVFTAFGQNTDACKVICAKKLDFDHPNSIIKNISNLKPCGLDDIDVKIFSQGPILGTIMVKLANHRKVVTWGDMLAGINEFKKTSGYRIMRERGGVIE